jgi:hypothetical protein
MKTRILFIWLMLTACLPTFGQSAMQTFKSVAEMVASNPHDARSNAVVESYHAGVGLGGGYFVRDNSQTAATNLGTCFPFGHASWTSAAGRWMRQVDNNLTPQMFGARVNGSNNDTTNMQSCLSVAGESKIPITLSGIVRITSPLVLTNNIRLSGEPNSEVFADFTLAASGSALYASSSSNLTVDGIIFRGLTNAPGSTNYYYALLGLTNCTDVAFRKCSFGSTWSEDIHFNGCTKATVDGCRFTGPAMRGLLDTASTNLLITACQFTGITTPATPLTAHTETAALSLCSRENVTVSDCYFRGNGYVNTNAVAARGDIIAGYTFYGTTNQIKRLKILNNTIDEHADTGLGGVTFGIIVFEGNDVVIQGNSVNQGRGFFNDSVGGTLPVNMNNNNGYGIAAYAAFYASPPQYSYAVNISHNTVTNCAGVGIYVPGAQGVRITDNQIDDVCLNMYIGSEPGTGGIGVHSSKDAIVSGNKISGGGHSAIGFGNITNLAISDNVCRAFSGSTNWAIYYPVTNWAGIFSRGNYLNPSQAIWRDTGGTNALIWHAGFGGANGDGYTIAYTNDLTLTNWSFTWDTPTKTAVVHGSATNATADNLIAWATASGTGLITSEFFFYPERHSGYADTNATLADQVRVTTNTYALLQNPIKHVTITGNLVEGYDVGIGDETQYTGLSESVISGNTINGLGEGRYGIKLWQSTNVVVHGNFIRDAVYHAIQLGNVDNVSVQGNYCSTTPGVTNTSSAIDILFATNSVVQNNVVRGWPNGMSIEATASSLNLVRNNDIQGATNYTYTTAFGLEDGRGMRTKYITNLTDTLALEYSPDGALFNVDSTTNVVVTNVTGIEAGQVFQVGNYNATNVVYITNLPPFRLPRGTISIGSGSNIVFVADSARLVRPLASVDGSIYISDDNTNVTSSLPIWVPYGLKLGATKQIAITNVGTRDIAFDIQNTNVVTMKIETEGGADVGNTYVKNSVRVGDGSYSFPSISFTNSPTMGFYRYSANAMMFAVAGGFGMLMGSTGINSYLPVTIYGLLKRDSLSAVASGNLLEIKNYATNKFVVDWAGQIAVNNTNGLNTIVDVAMPGGTTNRLVYHSGILVSNIVSY